MAWRHIFFREGSRRALIANDWGRRTGHALPEYLAAALTDARTVNRILAAGIPSRCSFFPRPLSDPFEAAHAQRDSEVSAQRAREPPFRRTVTATARSQSSCKASDPRGTALSSGAGWPCGAGRIHAWRFLAGRTVRWRSMSRSAISSHGGVRVDFQSPGPARPCSSPGAESGTQAHLHQLD